jgi:diaminopimelate decarboxylase
MLTTALYEKAAPDRSFLIVDAGMNDLMRPALYGAHHDIRPLKQAATDAAGKDL